MRFTLFVSIITSGLFLMDIKFETARPLMNEICDNAIDDDGDGLIDFNDEECDCPIAEPVSLIPNPSFETQECCPPSHSRLDCAETWLQASEATTDYIHECGFGGWPDIEVPLPLPDGDGCIGYRDGRPGVDGMPPLPNWKEYTGACLTGPLRANESYRFQFYIGFANEENSPTTSINFYGTTSCDNLPFGIGDSNFGCPTNDPNWVLLGSVGASGLRGWIQTQINVMPTKDIKAIAIGPDCLERPRDISLYYFFDNLILAEQGAFEYEITPVSGHPCEPNYTLAVPKEDSLSYQWYKNGIALVGETSSTLNTNYGLGQYQTLLLGPNSCRITKRFFHNPTVIRKTKQGVVCEGNAYDFHGVELDAPGIYIDTLKSVNSCDSIVELELLEEAKAPEVRPVKIVSNEVYNIGPYNFTEEGEYNVKLKSIYGCDSTILLQLSHFNLFIPNAFSPNQDGINDRFMIFENEDIQQIKSLSVFDRWGNLMYQEKDLLPGEPDRGWDGRFGSRLSPNGLYVYTTQIIFSDGEERNFSGSVTLIR